MSNKIHVTPAGVLTGFVNILKADFKYDEAGKYKFKLELSKKDAEKIIALVEGARDEAAADFKNDPKNKGKRLKQADLPFYEDEDTGKIIFSFSSKATYVDKKTEQRKERVLPIFGANGRIKPEDCPNFGAGSTVKVAFMVNGFANAALGAGCSLRIDSVKLLKPVEFSGGGATNHFGDDDEGYVPPQSEGFPDDSSSDSDSADSGDDF